MTQSIRVGVIGTSWWAAAMQLGCLPWSNAMTTFFGSFR
jgi:hypothetical protein